MNDHAFVLRIKKLKGKRIVLAAAKHNLRELVAELGADSHIDIHRMSNNTIIKGSKTAKGVADYESSLLADAEFPHPLRVDSVRAIELIFSLPPDSKINHLDYFSAASDWAGKFYNVPILSSIIHADEAAPHCHVLMLPLVDGKMIGSALAGNKARYLATQSDFHAQVAAKYGLVRQSPQKRHSLAVRKDIASKALALIKSDHNLLNEPSIKDALLDLFAANPVSLASALGFEVKPPKQSKEKSFVEIMTKPQKLERLKPIGFQSSKPIGLQPKNNQSLCSVGFQIINDVNNITEPSQTAYQRIHENDLQSGYWDSESGEFITPTIKEKSLSPAIDNARAQITNLQSRRQA